MKISTINVMVGIFLRKIRNHMENIIDRNIFL